MSTRRVNGVMFTCDACGEEEFMPDGEAAKIGFYPPPPWWFLIIGPAIGEKPYVTEYCSTECFNQYVPPNTREAER